MRAWLQLAPSAPPLPRNAGTRTVGTGLPARPWASPFSRPDVVTRADSVGPEIDTSPADGPDPVPPGAVPTAYPADPERPSMPLRVVAPGSGAVSVHPSSCEGPDRACDASVWAGQSGWERWTRGGPRTGWPDEKPKITK